MVLKKLMDTFHRILSLGKKTNVPENLNLSPQHPKRKLLIPVLGKKVKQLNMEQLSIEKK